jgi:hypothetical protein
MQLRDIHPDLERYLTDDCYGKIYDTPCLGITQGYMCFDANDECMIVEQNENMTAVIAGTQYPQIIIFWHDEPSEPNKIIDAERIDATKNNMEIARDIVRGVGPDGRKIEWDEYSTITLEEAFAICEEVLYE